MDIDSLSKGIGLFSSAILAVKQAIELLPDGAKKENASAALQRAEREFKIAEAQSAAQLKYQICRNHFPPEVMLSNDERHWKCPSCGNMKDTSPRAIII